MVQMAPGKSQTKHEREEPGVSSSSPAADCKFRAKFLPLPCAAGRHACARVEFLSSVEDSAEKSVCLPVTFIMSLLELFVFARMQCYLTVLHNLSCAAILRSEVRRMSSYSRTSLTVSGKWS